MEKQIISMVYETDPRYLEIRQESLRKARHCFWGQDQMNDYERDLKIGRAEQYIKTVAALDEDIASIDAELAALDDTDVKRAQLEQEKVTKKQEWYYFKSLLHSTQHLLHKLFGGLIGDVMGEEVGNPDGERTGFLRQELGEMFGAPEIREELKCYFGENLENFTAIGLYLKIIDPETEIPADFLYRVLKHHHKEMRARAEHVEKIVENLKEEFFSLIKVEIEQGRLPLEIETVKQRLALVVGRVIDRLEAPTSDTTAMHSADGLIQIYSSEIGEEQFDALRATVFHELVHELSGKSIQLVTREIFMGKESRVRDRKSGVRIAADSDSVIANRFVWLNEAITEWYAQKLSQYQVKGNSEEFAYKGSVAYIGERKELDRLFEKGLSEEVVLAAYFENIHEGQSKGKRGTAFATLLKTINALEDDRHAFTRLENQFALKGAKSYLRGKGIYSAMWVEEVLRSELSSGVKLYPIVFSVGIQERTRATESFFCVVPPYAAQTEKLLGADYDTKKMESALAEAKILSGGERCKYTIGDPEVIA